MTNLKKLILMALLALPLSLAVGCGDDEPGNGNGEEDGGINGGENVVDLGKHCRDNAEAWKLTALNVEPHHGFNLDNQNTTEVVEPKHPSTGCGVKDGADGLDNGFGELLGLLPTLAPDLDINQVIAEALADGSVAVMAYIRGYEEGGANDNIELTLLVNQVEYPELVDVKATYEDGKIVATLDKLPLSLSGIEVNLGESPAELNLTITILNVRVEIEEPAGGVSSTMTMLGGAVQYYGDGGLSADLGALIEQLDLDLDLDIDDIVGGLLDISSDGTNCDSLSIGAQVGFTYSDLCE